MGIIDKIFAETAGSSSLKISSDKITVDTDILTRAVAWIGTLAGVLVFFYLVYGGFLYLTAAGNAEQSKKGGQAILNAIIGILIILLAYGLTTWLIKL